MFLKLYFFFLLICLLKSSSGFNQYHHHHPHHQYREQTDYVQINGENYNYFFIKLSWREAFTKCDEQNALLWAPKNPNEIQTIMSDLARGDISMWLGYNDLDEEGVWKSTDADAYPISDWWRVGEPNGLFFEGCAFLTRDNNAVDLNCWERHNFVCKKTRGETTLPMKIVENNHEVSKIIEKLPEKIEFLDKQNVINTETNKKINDLSNNLEVKLTKQENKIDSLNKQNVENMEKKLEKSQNEIILLTQKLKNLEAKMSEQTDVMQQLIDKKTLPYTQLVVLPDDIRKLKDNQNQISNDIEKLKTAFEEHKNQEVIGRNDLWDKKFEELEKKYAENQKVKSLLDQNEMKNKNSTVDAKIEDAKKVTSDKISYFRNDYVYKEKHKASYKLNNNKMIWSAAKRLCNDEGAELMVPMSDEELSTISEMFINTLEEFWIGSQQSLQDYELYLLSELSKEKVHNKWKNQQDLGSENKNNCIVMLTNGEYSNVECDLVQSFVCKKEDTIQKNNSICGTIDEAYFYSTSVKVCYKIHTAAKKWQDALEECNQENAFLAIINSREEASLYGEVFSQQPQEALIGQLTENLAIIGFNDLLQRGIFLTIESETLAAAGYEEWDFLQFDRKPNERCGAMTRSGQLHGIDCDAPAIFICEKTPVENNTNNL